MAKKKYQESDNSSFRFLSKALDVIYIYKKSRILAECHVIFDFNGMIRKMDSTLVSPCM